MLGEYLPLPIQQVCFDDVLLPREYGRLMREEIKNLSFRLSYTGFKDWGLKGLRRSLETLFIYTGLVVKGMFVKPNWELRHALKAIYDAS
jgi:hypothetical protein